MPTRSTLNAGDSLGAGEALTSPDGRLRLVMQTDGNLVLYNERNEVLWKSATQGAGMRAQLQPDGNFVVQASGRVAWNSGTAQFGRTTLTLTNDGNFAIWDGPRRLWSMREGYRGQILRSGEALGAGDVVRSPAGRFRLIMQSDGNLVLYDNRTVAHWHTVTNGTGESARVTMQRDGNLVLGIPGRVTWTSGTDGFAGASAHVQDDGNVVIYHDGRGVWSRFDGYRADTLHPGETLNPGQSLRSQDGRLRLYMQPTDGNLVLYGPSGALWTFDTVGAPGARAVMQTDGNFVVYRGYTPVRWTSTSVPGGRMVLQNDENLVIYANTGAVWSRRDGLIGSGGGPGAPGGATGGYPHAGATDCTAQFGVYSWCVGGSWLSPRGYAYRNCTDWAAWRLQQMGASDAMTRGLEHGGRWGTRAGGRMSGTPKVGRAAVRPSRSGDDFGHVAVVEAVHANGQITVSEYNRAGTGTYSTWTGAPSQRGFTQFVDMGI